ncbi:MAG TPA: hypothetical protein VEK15_24530 [Vicinamibacteria bacterium]|nr:hypothetical protein [Vicinamibacteria bacterium]
MLERSERATRSSRPNLLTEHEASALIEGAEKLLLVRGALVELAV